MTNPPDVPNSQGSEPSSPCCPACGADIPADAPSGLCPPCLAAASAKTQPGSGAHSAGAFSPPSVEALNELLQGFEISEMIGRGGMGAVYKARQIKLDRTVALKILPESIATDATFAERFTREAQALAQLSHPNIINVYDVDTAADGLCYIVMEYVDGANLRAVLESGHLSPREALAIVVQICEALQYAHDTGIVHRDIKPENILITENGRVKIADFGLVKLVGGNSPDFAVTLTATHQAMGTVQYMAPEQLSGSVEADHRADIYSLGVVFYEMLTGEIPAGRFDPPSERVQLDVRLDEVVLRALDGHPDRRYQSAGAIRDEVETIQKSGAGGAASPPPLGDGGDRPPSNRDSDTPAPRFSRKAIVGAIWAPFFIVALLAMFTATAVRVEPSDSGNALPVGRSLGQWLALLFLGIPGILAPIGTTVMGIVAISDIRHSRGRITGLPLAVADALLFPLLLMVGVIFTLVNLLTPAYSPKDQPWFAPYIMPVVSIATLAGTLVLVFFIVRATWRAAKRPPVAAD